MKIGMAFLTLLLNSGLIFIGATAAVIPYINIPQNDSVAIINNSATAAVIPYINIPQNDSVTIINNSATATVIPYINIPQNDSVAINYRLPDYVIPRHYDIELTLYIKEDNETVFNFSGRMAADIVIYRPIYNISLHAQEPYIKVFRSRLVNENVDLELRQMDQEAVKIVYSDKTNILTFHFDTEISEGNYHLLMEFNGTAYDDSNGLFKTAYVDRNGKIAYVAGTHFQTIGARQVFPCWDEPAIRVKFNISIKHHANYTVLSNMAKLAVNLDNDNMARSIFEIPATAAYLVAFIIINDKHFNEIKIEDKIGAIKYRHDLARYVNFAEIVANRVIIHLPTKLREKFSKSFFSSVAIPGLRDNGIANSGLIIYREADIIYDEKLYSTMHKVRIASLVAYKMAHQWFCNYMNNPSYWSSLWLHDAISTLLGTYTIDKIYPNFRISDLFVVQVLQESLHLDQGSIMKPLDSKLETLSEMDSFAFSRYIKGPAILHMLQHVLTDNIFWHGIGVYLKKLYKLNPYDFWNDMQIVVENSPYDLPISIEQLMNTWNKKHHYHVLKVKRDHTTASNVLITVEKFGKLKRDEWWIPVSFTTQTECNFTQSFNRAWLQIPPMTLPEFHFRLPYDEDGWLIFNKQQSGYYRVNYDSVNWQRIIRFLRMKNHTEIHVLNRAQIIDDAFYFMLNDQLEPEPSVFWDVASYLYRETDYIAWYPMFKALEYMSGVFPLQEKEVSKIKEKILVLLDNLLANIGYDEDPNEDDLTKSLRQEAAKWACTLNSLKCINVAKKKLTEHLTHTKTHKLLPWWKEWTYCKGMIMANNQLWGKLVREYFKPRKSGDYKIFKAIAGYKNFNTSKVYLDLIGTEYDILEKDVKGRVYAFFYIITKQADNAEIMDYLLTHFEKVKPKEISTVAALIYVINHINNREEFYKIRDFVENNAKHLLSDIEVKMKKRCYQIRLWFTYTLGIFGSNKDITCRY